jgi:hypothetical protein
LKPGERAVMSTSSATDMASELKDKDSATIRGALSEHTHTQPHVAVMTP